MTGTTYTPEQTAFAERVSRALSNIPGDRLPMLETIVETLLAGASIAATPRQTDRERVGA